MIAAAALLLLALLGAPLFAVIAASALRGFRGAGIDISVVAVEINRLVDTPLLQAIPLFTFAGYLLGESRSPDRLLRLARAAFGWLPGGVAIVSLAVCALFTAFTGASGVTIVALGALLLSMLRADGYPERFSLGLITTGGSLGLLLPPAVPVILYGIVAGTSVDRMFAAGLVPSLLMFLLLGAYAVAQARRARVPAEPFAWRNLAQALREAALEAPLPVLLLGAIYSGLLAASEAAAVTAAYVFLVTVVLRREVPLRQLPAVVRRSMVLVGGILVIMGVGMASSNYLIDQQVPTRLLEFVTRHVGSRFAFLILLNVFLLVLGCLLDVYSAIIVVVPLLLPTARTYGVDPVHLGIIFLANMQIGYCTPPVGMSLFIASYRFNRPVLALSRAALPFMLLLLAVVLAITWWPALSLTAAAGVR